MTQNDKKMTSIELKMTNFLAWGLVSVYNMAGHDGRQDYDMIDQPCDWDTLVMEEHAHEFKDGDVFDPNQELYRVSFSIFSEIRLNFGKFQNFHFQV